ncbi:hypothetical protein ACWGLF_27135 [Streptomyces puniciscabiei]
MIDADWLRALCLDAGADDAAAVSLDHPDLAGERAHVLAALPGTRSLVSLTVLMNRDNTRSRAQRGQPGVPPDRRTGRRRRPFGGPGPGGRRWSRAQPSAGFPQETERFPGRIRVVAHKTVAVAAGLGVMGLHRNVVHARFGTFVLLATVLVDAPVSAYGRQLDHGSCVDCKPRVAACPAGAIGKDGSFDALACTTHNYREFMSGFTDWAQTVADSVDAADFRSRVTDPRTRRCATSRSRRSPADGGRARRSAESSGTQCAPAASRRLAGREWRKGIEGPRDRRSGRSGERPERMDSPFPAPSASARLVTDTEGRPTTGPTKLRLTDLVPTIRHRRHTGQPNEPPG